MSIIRRLSWRNTLAYWRLRKFRRSVSKLNNSLSRSSRRWCSARSRSRTESFCDTSPTLRSRERICEVTSEIWVVSRDSLARVAARRAWTSLSLLSSPAAGEARTSPAMRTRASLRAMGEASAGLRTSLPSRRAPLGASARLLGLLRGQRPRLRHDRRLRRIPLVWRRIGLWDDYWAAGGALPGLGRLIGQLDHLRRLNL